MKIVLDEIDDALAKCAHDIWSHWMRYMFTLGCLMMDDTVTWTLKKESVERWRRQMNTEYADLSEKEKVSDREIAEKLIKPILREIIKEQVHENMLLSAGE